MKADRTFYTCNGCGLTKMSGVLPKPPALAVYPLPPGWRSKWIAKTVFDQVLCGKCAKEDGIK